MRGGGRPAFILLALGLVCLLLFSGCDVLPLDRSHLEGGGLSPRSFALVSPADGATDISVTPTFSWEQSQDPEGKRVTYTLTVTPSQGGGAIVTSLQGTSYTLTNPLLAGTSYYWRVTAEDPEGNLRRSPYYAFTTISSGTGTGGGGMGVTVQTVAGFSLTGVRKGTVLQNPAFPSYLVYVYIDSSLNAFSKTSTDGGATWSSPVQIMGLSNVRDLSAALSATGNTMAVFIDDASDDACTGARVMTSLLAYGGSWTAPEERQGPNPTGVQRLPSVVHLNGNDFLFGWGFDASGSPDDTKANSFQWDGVSIVGQTDVGISPRPDYPEFCHQVAFDPLTNTLYYLYFTNKIDTENEGGDLYAIDGTYPSLAWSGGSPVRVVNGGDYQRPSQGFLFRANGGDYILIYALETGPMASPTGNTLYMRRSSSIPTLENAADSMIESSLKIPQDTWSRYRTLYAVQDKAGHIHVVWQDTGNNIKWVKIDSSTYTMGTVYTVATGKHLDSISVGQNVLYVSTISDLNSSNSASIEKLYF